MKVLKFLSLLLLLPVVISCSTDSGDREIIPQPLPDRTPVVMGLLEATSDTVHHHPELVVGYVRNVDGYFNPDRTKDIPGLYNPTLLTQAVRTFRRFHLNFIPDDYAEVQVTGPIGTNDENTVSYTNFGEGVYGDENQALKLIPEGQYRLNVLFSDGRSYGAVTTIPAEVDIEVPDSLSIQADYAPYNDGSAKEATPHQAYHFISLTYPVGNYLTVVQSNSDKDRETLLMEPGEQFLFGDHSPYLRSGSMYTIAMLETGQRDSLRRRWAQDLYHKYKEDVWHSQQVWMRFSFFNKGIGGLFFPLIEVMYAAKGEAYDRMLNNYIEAFEGRNPSYLLETSTIRKMNDAGELMNKEESDAIGFFGGYFSVYRKMTMYPLRTFDLDSVLSNNRVYNPQ